MKEIFYYAAKLGGYASKIGVFKDDWEFYDEDPFLLTKTPGFEVEYSPVKQNIYIKPTEYQCGIMVLNYNDLREILKLMERAREMDSTFVV